MWVELVWNNRGTGNHEWYFWISAHRASDYTLSSLSHQLRSHRYEVRIKWFFNLLFNFQFPSSCIFSRLIKIRFEWMYSWTYLTYNVCTYLESIQKMDACFDSSLRQSSREVWSSCLWKIIFNYRNMFEILSSHNYTPIVSPLLFYHRKYS